MQGISQSADVEMASENVTETATSPNSLTSAEDAASSLRAAALLTLKFNKRRKPNEQAAQLSSLSRPTVDNSVQLDYGQDDISSSPPENLPPQSPSKVPQIDMEDGQIREDGEISDSEPAAVAAANGQLAATPSSSPIKRPVPSTPDVHPDGTHNDHSPVLPKVESPSNLLDRISDVSMSASESFGQPQLFEANNKVHFVDVDHVRPGLEMNQEQYDTAKDIVLDLLGWGVPPEYLIDCGLSREIVFYVFSELNLRLPVNLDTNGIIPYSPSTLKALLRDPSHVSSPLGSESGSQRLSGHPSLPLKPPAPGQERSRKATGDAAGAAALHDMERQRRQELLARKAVQASRKNGGSTSPTTKPAASDDQDVEMASLVPSESVDDFLKSIEPVRSDRMDVDEFPLVGSTPSIVPQESTSVMVESPTSLPMQTDELPVSSGASTSGQVSRRSSSSDDTSGPSNGAQRRGKRPVAADFVDFDAAPRHRNGSSTRQKNGGSFASISTMRRCVIDLSDSEGEMDGHDVQTTKPAASSRYSTPPISTGTSNHRTMSPAALAEKELEIQKMRQMIAEREQGRVKKLKKLEAMSNSDAVAVKQEEEELTTSLATPVHESPATEHPATSTDTAPSTIDMGNNDTTDTPSSTTATTENQESETTFGSGNDQAAPEIQQDPVTEAVDVDLASSSSAQMTPALLQHHLKPEEKVLQPEKHEEHAVYISIFDSYPLLRSRPLLQIDSSIISLNPQTSPSLASSSNPNHTNISSPSHNVSYTPSSSFFMSRHLSPSLLPDLRPLRLATASQFLGSSKRLCQYEIPGGGRCADAGCEDIHISRMGGSASMDANVEPGDQDTADYLSTAVPDSWVTAYGSSLTSRLVAALEDTRLNHPTITLEERVARVCDMLQPHPPTT